jgi:membrane protease YdiL (CAAX protease family)
VTASATTRTRRADRLRRNPFLVIAVGFVVLLGLLEGLAVAIAAALGDGPWARLLAAAIVAPIAVLVYRWLITRFLEGRASAPEIDINTRAVRLFGRGFLLAVAIMAVALALIALLGSVAVSAGIPIGQALAGSVAIAVLAGVVEELFLRGVLYRVTEQYLGSWLAIVVSALFFGFLHLANPGASLWAGIAIALEAGVSLAAIYALTRTLWAVIGVHIGWNFTESFLGIPVSGNEPAGLVTMTLGGPEWVSGGSFGAETSVVVVFVWLVVAAWALYLARRRHVLIRPAWTREKLA